MTKTLQPIQRQIETLQREAENVERKELEGVVAQIKEAISRYELSTCELGLSGGGFAPRAAQAVKRAAANRKERSAIARLQNDAGKTRVGRGPCPRWLGHAMAQGKQLQDFAV